MTVLKNTDLTLAKQLLIKVLFLFVLFQFNGCTYQQEASDAKINYELRENWACYPEDYTYSTDVFFIAPTVFLGDSLNWNLQMNDSITKNNFIGAINMEKGIYDMNANFYAPFYRQVSIKAYEERGYSDSSNIASVEQAFQLAYSDVAQSFDYFLAQSERPFVLAGFSQGSEMLIKLIKEKLSAKKLQDRHIASYAIGWRLTESDIVNYNHLVNAKSKDDLGVVICFNSEAEFIKSSILVPDKTLAINPLNWSTDTTLATKADNLGACFTNYNGAIEKEIPHFTGAYISPNRGTLKVLDVNPDDFYINLPIFQKGVYHLYDYQFFYRNLQENVNLRISKYKKAHKS